MDNNQITLLKNLFAQTTAEFKVVNPKIDGFERTYIVTNVQVWDIDDGNTTFIKGGETALVCFEGQLKNGNREGVFNAYLIDSTDHSKRYKIYEQTYSNDKLNGQLTHFMEHLKILKHSRMIV